MLKPKDLKRATLIEACIKGQCTVKQVATVLGLSERRVKQIKKEVKENGVKSIQHGNRGRKPKNTIPEETKKKISEAMKGINTGKNSPNARSLICITTNEVFDTITEAAKNYNICRSNIVKCCNGKYKYTGKLPTGEKLVWRYIDIIEL